MEKFAVRAWSALRWVELHMETVTVAASRGGSMMSGTTLLIVSVVVLAAVAFAVARHFRNRNEHSA
jgi:hypothetical protein